MKYTKLKILFFCFLGTTIGTKAFAQETEVITLQQAVEKTLANNLQIKQAQYQAAITDENLKQTKYELYPNVTSNASANRQFGLFFDQQSGRLLNSSVDQVNGRISSSVVLFGGGTLMNQIKQNKAFLMSDKSNIEKMKNDLSLSVVNTYLQILNNQDLIKASRQQLDLSNQQLGVAQKNFDVGNNTQADLSQAKAQVANNELSLTNAQNAYELSVLNLKQLMEMNPEQNITVQIPAIADPENIKNNYTGYDVYTKAVVNYPDVKLAEYNTEAFKYGINVAKGNLYPSLSFGGGLSTGYSSSVPSSFNDQITNRNFGQYLGFNLSIPIFNNYRNRANYNIAKIRYDNAKAAEQLAKNNLNKIISQAVQDLKSAIKSYDATKSAFNSSKEAFNVIKQRYEVGLVNVIELNTSQTNYNKAEFDFIQAKYNVIFRQKVIDFYLGNPLTL
ncbi:TolC family protein [Pedobacter sp. SD-b]|uniref:TolC family protein n=1 Tax=Pedobacter segetis TaxID=2793069 RepID=A0ABS1BHS1_9SPHI|nr:TolC family protein [Pedobacter segetis]MBK0382395.1 TolC family protein [Pedobacter segetis]